MSDIGKNIYSARKEARMTMEELGKKIGVSKGTIKRYETGEIKNIPSDKIEKIAVATGVSEIELMGWAETIYKNNTNTALKASIIAMLEKLDENDLKLIYEFANRLI